MCTQFLSPPVLDNECGILCNYHAQVWVVAKACLAKNGELLLNTKMLISHSGPGINVLQIHACCKAHYRFFPRLLVGISLDLCHDGWMLMGEV